MAAPKPNRAPKAPPTPSKVVGGAGYTSSSLSGVGTVRASADSTATESEVVRRFLPEIHAVIEAKVGQMKAELAGDFDRKLEEVKTRLGHLPSTTTFVFT